MARPTKSRLTPKGTRPAGTLNPEAQIADGELPSPAWFGWIILALMMFGVGIIFSNYMSWLPGSPSSRWILGGLGFVLAGLLTATRWR